LDRLINNAVVNASVLKPAMLLPILRLTLLLKTRQQRYFASAACPQGEFTLIGSGSYFGTYLCLDNTFDYGSWRGF